MTDPLLHHTAIDPMVPLDGQMGQWPLLQVPAALEDALFGPCPGAENAPLFAVLEGARIPDLMNRLTREHIAFLPLYQGELAENLGDDAPVVAQLPRAAPLTRALFTTLDDEDAPGALLPREAAFFLRSSGALATIHKHLRRFTALPTEGGNRIFFRYWEPACAPLYFAHIARNAGQVAAWMNRSDAPILRLVIPGRTATGWCAHVFAPALPPDSAATAPTLDADAREIIRLGRFNANVLEALRLAQKTFPEDLAGRDPNTLRSQIEALYRRLIPLGFHTKRGLFLLASYELLYGPGFETRDPDGQLSALLNAPGDERPKLDAIRTRMTSLPPALFSAQPVAT